MSQMTSWISYKILHSLSVPVNSQPVGWAEQSHLYNYIYQRVYVWLTYPEGHGCHSSSFTPKVFLVDQVLTPASVLDPSLFLPPAVLVSTAHWVHLCFSRLIYCPTHPPSIQPSISTRFSTLEEHAAAAGRQVLTGRPLLWIFSHLLLFFPPLLCWRCHAPLQLYLSLTAVHVLSWGGRLWQADMHDCVYVCVCLCVCECECKKNMEKMPQLIHAEALLGFSPPPLTLQPVSRSEPLHQNKTRAPPSSPTPLFLLQFLSLSSHTHHIAPSLHSSCLISHFVLFMSSTFS